MSVYIQLVISIPIFFLGLVAIVLIDKYNFNSKSNSESNSEFKNRLLFLKFFLLGIVVPLSMILLINSIITLAKKYGIIFESVMDYNDTVLMLLSTFFAYAIAYVQFYFDKQKLIEEEKKEEREKKEREEKEERERKEREEKEERERKEREEKRVLERHSQQVRAVNVLSGQKGYAENINIKNLILGYVKDDFGHNDFKYNIEIGDFLNADACFYQPYFEIKDKTLTCTYIGKDYIIKDEINPSQFELYSNTLIIRLNLFDEFFLFPARFSKNEKSDVPKIEILLTCRGEDMSFSNSSYDYKQIHYSISFYIVPDSGYSLDGKFNIKIYNATIKSAI